MHNLVPQLILDEFARGKKHGDFHAASLFVDISGFSVMTNDLVQYGQHGAEVLAIVMREIFSPLVCGVYDQGGFIANYAGDAFTALFPSGADEESVGWRCVATAWGIQQNMAENPIYSTPYGDFEITVRVGMAAGLASWGIVTTEQKDQAAYYFRGSAVEGCAEAESLAAPGEIIIDKEAYALVKDYIHAEQKEEHYRITGIAEAIPDCEETESPDQDLEISKLFFPEELITQTPMGEFRQVINMFISLPTVRTEEQLLILMRTLFALLKNYGGFLSRVDFGDKGSNILLFWGAPIAFGNDIGRALNFILTLQTETSIPIKAGVTYKIAHAGFIGAPRREEYTCYGPGINLAARFMTKAPRGAVWVDEEIAKRVQQHFEIDYIDEISLKGFPDKQKVFILHERKELFETFYKGELVGRDRELTRLSEFVEPLWDGKYAGALLVSGDAGIGKSRLLHEFLKNSEILNDKRVKFALCHTDQVLRRSFNPFRYWLKHYFGVLDTQVESRNKRSFNQVLDRLISSTADESLSAELDRTRSFLGALVNLFWQDSLYEQLDPENRYENTLIALLALLKAESLQQPLILHLEDIQWIDEDSKIILSQLHRAISLDLKKHFPIAILATSRQHNEANALGDMEVEELFLQPLNGTETIELARSYLDLPVGSRLAKLLITLGEGNPFFTEQLLIYLKERELIFREDDEWQVNGMEKTPMPADVRALLIARIDQFPADAKDIILTASALGREFDVQVLGKMVGETRLLENIDAISAAFIWVEVSEGRYLFKNNMLKDAAYLMQIHTRRQELHGRAVEALEQVYSKDLEPHYFELAYHAEKGMLKKRARIYLHAAGDTAGESYNNDLAIDAYTRALKFVDDHDLVVRLSLIMKRENLYGLIGEREAQKKDLEQSKFLAEEIGEPLLKAKTALRRVQYYWDVSEYRQAVEEAETAIKYGEAANVPEIVARANVLWGAVLRMLGEYEDARARLSSSRELAQETGDYRGECSSLNNLGIVELDAGNYLQAKEYFEESRPLAQACGSLYFEAQVLSNLGNVAGEQGDYSSALEYYGRALTLSQKIGTRIGESLQKNNLGWLAGIMGDYSSSREYLEESLQISREIGAGFTEATALMNLSLFSWAQTDYSAALAFSEEALDLTRAISFRSGEAFAYTFLGHANSGLKKYQSAKTSYLEALAIRRELDQHNLLCEPLAGLADLAFEEGKLLEAESYIAEILHHLDGGGSLEGVDIPILIYTVCYKVLQASKSERASDILEKAHDLLQAQVEKIKDNELRESFMENVPWHAEILNYYANRDSSGE
jgi:predicted ATPase/class 3 adenylate cyclase